jgi:hypothetical protein
VNLLPAILGGAAIGALLALTNVQPLWLRYALLVVLSLAWAWLVR